MTAQQRQFYNENCLLPQDTLDRNKEKGIKLLEDRNKENAKALSPQLEAFASILGRKRSRGGPSKPSASITKVQPISSADLSFELTLDSLEKLSRAQLQEAAKKYGIKANSASKVIIEDLRKILEDLPM